jgi:hypothetical protein
MPLAVCQLSYLSSTAQVVFSLNQKDMWCLFLGGEAAQKQTPQPFFIVSDLAREPPSDCSQVAIELPVLKISQNAHPCGWTMPMGVPWCFSHGRSMVFFPWASI